MTMRTEQTTRAPLDRDQVARMNAWWRAANHLSVGQIHLLDNPPLRESLRMEHVKPRLLVMAAVDPMRTLLPDLLVRVVNAVDLMTLQPKAMHPHGLSDPDFNALFTTSAPVIFAFRGYPGLIHTLVYKRASHANFNVRGFIEEGTTTTPFDMVVRNRLDRFHLVGDVIDRVPRFGAEAACAKQAIRDKLIEHERFIVRHGKDMPEVSLRLAPGRRGMSRRATRIDPRAGGC